MRVSRRFGLASLLLCGLALDGCQRPAPERERASEPATAEAPAATEPADQPLAPSTDPTSGAVVELGLRAGPDGKVADPMLSFAPGDPVCVSLRLPEGGSGGRAEAAWYGPDDAELGRAGAALSGSPPHGAWCLPGAERLAPGTYRLELAVDGSAMTTSQIAVTDAREPARTRGGS